MQSEVENLVQLIQRYLLTDDLRMMARANSEIPGDGVRDALKLFLSGRHNIETSWDYAKTIDSYEKAIQSIDGTGPDSNQKPEVLWLRSAIAGHHMLQLAEASWTLCNFDQSAEEYTAASKSFLEGLKMIENPREPEPFQEIRQYSGGWGELAVGMKHNLRGESLLRSRKVEEAKKEFEEGKQHLVRAQECFASIHNQLGLSDARSYVVDGTIWEKQQLITCNGCKVIWRDFLSFEDESTLERILQRMESTRSRLPSEFITRTDAEALRLMTADIGTLKISKLGDSDLAQIEVRINFHPEYVVEVEYTLKVTKPIDLFLLYLLKILNTDAVPTYDASFSGILPGLSFELKNCRLRDLTRRILERLAEDVGVSDKPRFLDSYIVMSIYDYSPKVAPSTLGKDKSSYLRGFFSESETLTLMPPSASMSTLPNLFHDISDSGAIAYLTDRAAIMVIPGMQEWEANMYSEVLEYVVEAKQTTSKVIHSLEGEADLLAAKLEVLKNSVAMKSSVTQQEVRNLISDNLEIRLKALRLLEIQRRYEILKQSGIRDVRLFTSRAGEAIGVPNVLEKANLLTTRIEALYDTAFNLGQDYLSLVMAVNSDISRQAFNVLNLVMMGALGLAIVTAILETPVSVTFAGLAVFGTSFTGFLYLTYVKRKATRLHR